MRAAHLRKRSAPRRPLGLVTCALLGAIWLSCSPGGEAPRTDRPLVAVSVPPLAWFVESIAGDSVEVASLLPAGASPTNFEPGITTLRNIKASRLVVAVGHPNFPFERAWFADLLRDRDDVAVLRGAPGADASADPHWWLSPAAADALVDPLAAELAKLVPESADVFTANAAQLHARIAALDRQIGTELSAASGRRFLVFHPAWGAFAEHYGLEQLAIEDDGKHPDAYLLGQLIEKARAAGFRHVIVQPQIDPAHAQSVADALGASIVTLDPLAQDWEANLRSVATTLAQGVLVP